MIALCKEVRICSHPAWRLSHYSQRVLAPVILPLLYSFLLRCLGISRKATMPKSALYTLRWSTEHQWYELHAQESAAARPLQEEWWFAWLEEQSSFSFQGKQGRLSLLKEARERGGDYW